MSERPDSEPAAEPARHRPIRSFVLRQGRLTPAQQRAFDEHWARFGREPAGQPVDWDAVFDRKARRVLEIGFGNGEALRWAAGRHPDWDFVGIEVHRPGVGRLLNGLAEDGRDNARLYCHDAVEVLRHDFSEGSLDEVRIWFPDPWHKKRHNKRRLVQPEFVALLATRIRPGGRLHLATDWEAYAEHMHEVMDANPDFRNEAGPGQASPRPDTRPQTHFETRGQRLGHGVWDLLYQRT
ncbi:tRNA (guanosine(46)-N7)-methyltransferase TrmB [Pseudomarimonas salicorniae]|uniref:tRNA (guanine-N(7)-)-methyltransferase n=1 Tax=Pseudomarimonas salicorniae TaxID=2933270 RepID=A0ABT0GLV7_9GAMM|nr:tRNA (guanosine(46)-N7)-methyltransferase TrmB [Lysobacter sp. CAU 1642]MCK7595495.1 tRNA (guanosine(46)-N7)-methyltransferase TrmB [Lysobacter sp. CAU 1642]